LSCEYFLKLHNSYCFGADSQQRVINGYKLETDVMALHVVDYFQSDVWEQQNDIKK
jgi:hypothetical protein